MPKDGGSSRASTQHATEKPNSATAAGQRNVYGTNVHITNATNITFAPGALTPDERAGQPSIEKPELEEAVRRMVRQMAASRIAERWSTERVPVIAVLDIDNQTGENVDVALKLIMRDIETALLNWGHARLIDAAAQARLTLEIRRQYSDAFDPSQIAASGKLWGPRYIIDGVLYALRAPGGAGEREFFVYLRVINVETGELMFQSSAAIKKPKVGAVVVAQGSEAGPKAATDEERAPAKPAVPAPSQSRPRLPGAQ